MKTAAFFIVLSVMLVGFVAPSFAGMQEMSDEELERMNQTDEVTIKDIIIANAANVKINENWQIQPKFLIEIDLSALPPSAAQKLVCPVFGCVGNLATVGHGGFIPGNSSSPPFIPLYTPFYSPSYR